MIHVIVELLCLFNEKEKTSVPSFCKYGPKGEGFHCLMGNDGKMCSHLAFGKVEHEIAYAQEDGEVKEEDEWIGFGGDMEIENYDNKALTQLWHDICLKKMEEAHEEYMENIKNLDTTLPEIE